MTSISWHSPAPWLQADAFFYRGLQSKRYLPALPEPPLPALPLERGTTQPTREMCRRTGLSTGTRGTTSAKGFSSSGLLTLQMILAAVHEQDSTSRCPRCPRGHRAAAGAGLGSAGASLRSGDQTAPQPRRCNRQPQNNTVPYKSSHQRTTRCFMNAKPPN